jgi:hypothetical protein
MGPKRKTRPARSADDSAALAVPNVSVSMDEQHYIHPLSQHYSFTLTLSTILVLRNISCPLQNQHAHYVIALGNIAE